MTQSSVSQRRILVPTVIVVSTVIDQLSKRVAAEALQGRPPQNFFSGVFRLEYAENAGAFLSFGASLSPEHRFWLLTVAVAIFLAVLLYMVMTSLTLTRLQVWAMALILGGGISNLIDRFFREHGRVIDFMNMGIGSLRTGIFNVADVLIMVGIFGFMAVNIRESKKS